MADMVPHEIEPAERVGGAPHDVAREGVLAQIAGESDGAPAGRGDLGDNRLDPALVDVGDPDRGALPRKAQRAGPPHARCRRRDDPDLVCQAHVILPKSDAEILPSGSPDETG
jgi:hypothetical protein